MSAIGKWAVQGEDGVWISANRRIVAALAKNGLIRSCRHGHWHAQHGLTATDLHRIVFAGHADLLDCDFCAANQPAWGYLIEEHEVRVGSYEAWARSPTFACEECATLIDQNAREALYRRIAETSIGKILEGTSHLPDDVQDQVRTDIERDGFGPHTDNAVIQCREVHAPFFEHRTGDRMPLQAAIDKRLADG